MGFSIENSVPVLTVFLQGLLSFFSPCVLPLVPLYVSYLSGGAKTAGENGEIHYPKGKILIHTLFFVLGVSFAFFLLGFGFTALGRFFGKNQVLFARISGIIMILFGLYQLGLFGHSQAIEREHRIPFLLNQWAMGPLPALLLGFTFSFAWTPCVGPTLSSVLLMAGSAASSSRAFVLIGVYTAGFVLPFLAVGLFTGTVLDFFKRRQSVVRYTVKAGAVLLLFMGFMTLTGFMNGITGYLSDFGGQNSQMESSPDSTKSTPQETEKPADSEESSHSQTEPPAETEPKTFPAPDFTLTDQYGKEHTLSDYNGKIIFLNFWATWCSPCRSEMPEIEQLYQDHGCNTEDLIVLGVAGPGLGREGSAEDITAFLEENEYTFPVILDETGILFYQYGIQAYPTTFMIDADGNLFGFVRGAISREIMDNIIKQTMEGKRE